MELSSSSRSLPGRSHRRSWRGGAEAGDERLLAAPPLCFPVDVDGDGQVVQGRGPMALARDQGQEAERDVELQDKGREWALAAAPS